MTTEKLGSIYTDVAMVIVGDPCKLITDEDKYRAFVESGYEETSEILHWCGSQFSTEAKSTRSQTMSTKRRDLTSKLSVARIPVHEYEFNASPFGK